MESEHKVWIAFIIAFALAITSVVCVNVISLYQCRTTLLKDATRSVDDIYQACR